MPTHSRDRRSSDTQHRDSKQRQELLRQVGRAALAYCVQRMSHQDAPDSDPSYRDRRRSSRSQNRDAFTSASGSARQSETTCDLPPPPPARGDSDLHNVLSQVVAGLFSLGLRQLMHRTREARRRRRRQQQQQQAQASSSSSARVDNSNLNSGQRGAGEQVDPELSVALGSVTRELQAAADSIRRLAHTSTSGPGELHHRNCAVRAALVADADRLLRVLEEVQAGVNNMRNLHPGLRARPGTGRGESQGRGQGRGFDGAGARSGGRRARVRVRVAQRPSQGQRRYGYGRGGTGGLTGEEAGRRGYGEGGQASSHSWQSRPGPSRHHPSRVQFGGMPVRTGYR